MAYDSSTPHKITRQIQIKGGYEALTAAANVTLTKQSSNFLKITATGASRDVTLPAEEYYHGFFLIRNSSATALDLVVKNDAGSEIGTLNQGEWAWFTCGGTAAAGWQYMAQSGVNAIISQLDDSGYIYGGDDRDWSISHDGTTGLNIGIANNDAVSFVIQQGTTDYVNISTATGTEAISLGSTADDPDFVLLGTGDFTADTLGTVSMLGTTSLTIGDDVASWVFDGSGGLSETGMTTLSITPSGTVDIDATGAITLDSDGAVSIGGDAGTGAINLGTGAGARAILLGSSTAASVGIDAGVGALTMAADRGVNVTSGAATAGWIHTATGAAEDFTIQQAGGVDSSLYLLSAGTGADAVYVQASAGGIDIAAALGLDLTSAAATAGWTHSPTGDTQDLTISVAGGHNASLFLTSAGTGTDALGITASVGTLALAGAGGITLDASGATAQTVIQTGTDTAATGVSVWDNSGDAIYNWTGDGYMTRGSDRHDVSHRSQCVLFDDFLYKTIGAAHPWELLDGGGAGVAAPAISATGECGTVAMSSGTAGDATAIAALVGTTPVQMDGGGFVWEAKVKFTSVTTVCAAFVGLTDRKDAAEVPFTVAGGDAIAAVADDAVGFIWDTSGDTDVWFGAAVDGTTVDTGAAATNVGPTQNVYQTFRLEVSSDGATILGYIDNTLKITMSGAAGVSPDVNLYPVVVILSDDATPKVLEADWVYSAVAR